jgi:hypothetical protein
MVQNHQKELTMRLDKTPLGFYGPFKFFNRALALSKTLASGFRPACPRRLMPLLASTGFVVSAVNPALATPHYVDVNGTNATPPFLGWDTAATNIQDAVDLAAAGDEIVVTNGVYQTGGAGGFRDHDQPTSSDQDRQRAERQWS